MASVHTSEWLLLCSHESVLAELTRCLTREEKTVYKLYKHLVPLWLLLVLELAIPKFHVPGLVKSQELIVAQTESPAAANQGYREYIFIVSFSLMTNRI